MTVTVPPASPATLWHEVARRSRARRRALAQEAARQRSSWYYAKIATKSTSASARQAVRWGIRAVASTDPETPRRQRECGVVTLGEGVQLRVKDGDGYYAGLKTCGSAWRCAVCGAKIHARKADELSVGVASWQGADHEVSLVSLTVPHDAGDPLALLIGAERAGWRKIVSGGAWTRLRDLLGLAGYVSAFELTHSFENGWHPHYHVLLFHDRRLDAAGIAALYAHIFTRWSAACRRAGLRSPDPVHGVDIQPNCAGAQVAGYVAKVQEGDWGVAQEITRGDLKTARPGSRVPFEILADYQGNGDVRDRDLWREYVAATTRLTAIRWSRGLRVLVLSDPEERTDEELAAADVGGELVAHMPVAVWQRVIMARLELAVLAAAESGGIDAVNDLLAVHGCGRATAVPPGSQ